MLGASGSLGRRVCAAAERLLPDVRVLRAARRGAGAGSLRADLHAPASLRGAFEAADVAIDAVGPFEYDPAPLVRAALAAGCAWIDLADRAAFLAAAEDAARAAGAGAVVSGASAAPGLVEALGAAIAPEGTASLRAWLSVGSRKEVSGALLYALVRPLGRPLEDGTRSPGRVIARTLGGVPFWFGRHPWPRTGGGRGAGRAWRAELNIGMDHRAQARALAALAPLAGRLPPALLLRACRALRPATGAITRLGGERGALEVEALSSDGRTLASATVLAAHGLDLAALPALFAARALLAPGAPRGALSLADLLPPPLLRTSLREAGWTMTGL